MAHRLEQFERIILKVLIIIMAVVLASATLDLAWTIATYAITPPSFFLSVGEMINIFGLFLGILVGFELIEILKNYLQGKFLEVQNILVVGIIAFTRKVIFLDVKNMNPQTWMGIGGMILALSVSYFLVTRYEKKNEIASN